MRFNCGWRCSVTLLACLAAIPTSAQSPPPIEQLTSAALWQRLEFRINNVPAVTNPFDPDIIRLDAAFTLPSGQKISVPGFWYQGYQRGISGGSESLTTIGRSEWRVRFVPPEPGSYSISITIRTNGFISSAAAETNFTVAALNPTNRFGYVRTASSGQYFETADGRPLGLIGENIGWPGGRGTYDYDSWFAALQAAGENYARVWMCPWWLGLETDANSLTHYRLDRAWQLDYLLQVAEQRGIYILLCLDFHGMFEVTPDYWGGNNFWPTNPYNATNGGPCLSQNAFFTNPAAQVIYQKRLRYLVGRYGCSPNLLAWQLLNEIDNEYAYLKPADVASWHSVMGAWLHTNDPFQHLVTTSLTGSSDRPEIWTLPQLDFAAYHSYAEASPASRLATVAQSFLQKYRKPVIIDEFGTDWRGWNRNNDPFLRGFRQGLWGGALGGSVGTSISWWWETIHAESDYPVYSALRTILGRTGWGSGAWTNLSFRTSGPPPPAVDNLIAGGQAFEAFLIPNSSWGGRPSGQLAVANPMSAGYSGTTLNSFVHGSWHSDLKAPFRLNAWLTNNARMVVHLNSVSDGSTMVVRADGVELFRTNFPNLDGSFAVNDEYNLDIAVSLPGGKRLIEITNAGADWFFLDSVRLEQVLPASYPANWQPSPEAIGLRGQHESLLYVVAPGVSFPAGATNLSLPSQHGQIVTLTNIQTGIFFADWYDPASGAFVGSSKAASTNEVLVLPLPDFTEDVAAVLRSLPGLKLIEVSKNEVQLQLDSETGGHYIIQQSDDLLHWSTVSNLTNFSGTTLLTAPLSGAEAQSFFRANRPILGP
jgi:hypothetical protein